MKLYKNKRTKIYEKIKSNKVYLEKVGLHIYLFIKKFTMYIKN